MTKAQKETVYIDVDDEITAIIDKVVSSRNKIVALVLPKRTSALQSIVNMKLMKRTADEAKKHIVLITSESALLPLAGVVGVHVAKTLQSKPAIPPSPDQQRSDQPVDVDDPADLPDEKLDPKKPIGVLAGIDEETIEVDEEAEVPVAPTKKSAKKFAKNIRIPNFNKFRVGLFAVIFLLILAVVGWYVGMFILPKAKIVVRTDTSVITSDLRVVASPKTKVANSETLEMASSVKELKKSENLKVPTTGEKDAGERAQGKVQFVNCSKDDKLADTDLTIPAGTGLSSGNLTFITAKAVVVQPSGYTGNTCKEDKPSVEVSVIAQNPGDKYNLSARDYTVAGFSTVSATATAMTGGSTKLVKIVSQQDIDTAKQKLVDKLSNGVQDRLRIQLQESGFTALDDTFTTGSATVTSSPALNEEGAEATVTMANTFTLTGIRSDDVVQFVEKQITKQIDTSKQVIIDNGVGRATYKVTDNKGSGDVNVQVSFVATAGPQLDANAIKQEAAGKKKGETQEIIRKRPGVRDVSVEYSPFWVFSTPKKLDKITVIFDQSTDANK